MNAYLQSKLKNGEIEHSISEDAQVDTKINGFAVQTKLKPTLVSVHTDLGQYSKDWKWKNDKSCVWWFNPYSLVEVSKGLKINSFYLGNLLHVNNFLRINVL